MANPIPAAAWQPAFGPRRRLLKRKVGPADPRVVPALLALIIASLAGWLVHSPVREILGPIPSSAASLLVGAGAFFFAKRFLSDLRGGS